MSSVFLKRTRAREEYPLNLKTQEFIPNYRPKNWKDSSDVQNHTYRRSSMRSRFVNGRKNDNLPFSRLSIWSLVKDVRFLCNFLLSRSLAWSSSGPILEPAFELSPEFVSSEWRPSRSVTEKLNRKVNKL